MTRSSAQREVALAQSSDSTSMVTAGSTKYMDMKRVYRLVGDSITGSVLIASTFFESHGPFLRKREKAQLWGHDSTYLVKLL